MISKSKQVAVLVGALMASVNPLVATKAEAGAVSLSWLSRANCWVGGYYFNESLSYHVGVTHKLWTYSGQYRGGKLEWGKNTGWQTTWRSYSGRQLKTTGLTVYGNHWEMNGTTMRKLGSTYATNCNLSQW